MAIVRGLRVCPTCDGEESSPPCWSCGGDAYRWADTPAEEDIIVVVSADGGAIVVTLTFGTLLRGDD